MLKFKEKQLKKFLVLIFFFLKVCAFSQNTPFFFTPNASCLGKYGQIPISYFNGLAEISIPITCFKAKGYELPISLTYYASGNRPQDHPSWVGLGWSLHAGGVINRKINGYKDELSKRENCYSNGQEPSVDLSYIGYAKHFQEVTQSNFETFSSLERTANVGFQIDTEPDEFLVNVDGISASFYIVGYNDVRIKSKSNVDFRVEVKLEYQESEYVLYENKYNKSLSLKGDLFTYIKEIIIIKNDGTKYFFGGDLNSIEFSFCPMPKYELISNYKVNKNEFRALGTANSWFLRRIQLPNGETVSFNYEKDGVPIVVQDTHTSTALENTFYDSKTDARYYDNLSYVYLQPLYLKSIKSETTKNELSFERSRTSDLAYNISQKPFEFLVGCFRYIDCDHNEFEFSKLMEQNYYMKLDRIIENNKVIKLRYENSPTERLKLLSVFFYDKSDNMLNSYKLQYNTTKLPPYNSKEIDHWGFYNNKCYNDISYDDLKDFRTADEFYMKSEVLEKIIYPSGGYSEFYYEPHSYSMNAQQFPFTLVNQKGIAGGLRIKKIVTSDGHECVKREFDYINSDGSSSGILSGFPFYSVSGSQLITKQYTKWFGLIEKEKMRSYPYVLSSENSINQFSSTNGNHVTYSRVVERVSDGTSIEYEYSNHNNFMDEYPIVEFTNIDNYLISNKFISKELERGLLLSSKYIDSKGNIVKQETYKYNSDPKRYNNYVKSIAQYLNTGMTLFRYSALKIYTFCPFLISKTTTEFFLGNKGTVVTDNSYRYNSNKLLIEESITNSNGAKSRREIKYICDYDFSSTRQLVHPLREMQRLNIISYPIEEKEFVNGKLVKADIKTYMSFLFPGYTVYKPDAHYILKGHNGTDNTVLLSLEDDQILYSISKLMTKKYEYSYYEDGNIKEQLDCEKNVKTTYLWGYNGLYPIAKVENAKFEDVQQILGSCLIPRLYSETSHAVLFSQLDKLHENGNSFFATTYTYEPFIGMKSKTDYRGVSFFYEYDSFERLRMIIDENGRFVKVFDYNYKK